MTRHHDATAAGPRPRSTGVSIVLAAACVSLLAGCSLYKREVSAVASADYRLRHPIVVKEKDRTVEVFIGNSRGGLNPEQRAHVFAFAQEWRQEATGGIIVEVPVNTRNAAAAGGAAKEVQAILASAGVPPNGFVTRGYRVVNPARLGTLRLNYPRMAAETGPCGLWPADIGPTTETYRQNKPYWNLGCASQRNLASMVANPADLVQPRGETPPYAGRRSVVLDAYRKGEQTSSRAPSNDAAKISDVGK
jgi:pilus assembly protein CpaD